MITNSYSSRKTVQENIFCFYGTILNLVTKVVQTFPKSGKFLFNMQTGKCHPYAFGSESTKLLGLSVSENINVLHLVKAIF